MKIKKESMFNTLIRCANSCMKLGYIFLAFTLFPWAHECISVAFRWKSISEANLEFNDYFYYHCVCVVGALFFALSATVLLRYMEDE